MVCKTNRLNGFDHLSFGSIFREERKHANRLTVLTAALDDNRQRQFDVYRWFFFFKKNLSVAKNRSIFIV